MNSHRQSGYALLVVMFMAAAMMIAAAVVVPRAIQEGRREKEIEMIWRGKQYARAVKLFYRKTGRFPGSLDELTKLNVNNVRFLRQDYKDPFNKEDGSWRLIYVGPGGVLIGSVKQPPPGQQGISIQMPNSQPGATPGGQPSPGQPGVATPSNPIPPGAQGAPLGTSLQPLSTGTGQPIGGAIIGVGSKVNTPSIIVYDGGTTYREWEFIWNPAKDPITIGGTGATGAPPQTGTTIGAPPAGTMPPPPPPPPRQPQN
jgi:hypothetical protein